MFCSLLSLNSGVKIPTSNGNLLLMSLSIVLIYALTINKNFKLNGAYTDDCFGAGPIPVLNKMIDDITMDANTVVCNNSIPTTKTLFGQDIPIIGAQIKYINFTIGVLEKHFGIMFHLLFKAIPPVQTQVIPSPFNLHYHSQAT